MMNVALKLRQRKGFCLPRGPSFKRARRTRLLIEGTQIEFRAPKHRPSVKGYKARYLERSRYFYDDMTFRSNFDKDLTVADVWKSFNLYYHKWAFNGPWFTGTLAELSLSFFIITPSEPDNKVSFFHPRAFEQTVGDYLTNEYAVRKSYGRPLWIAPQNWQPIDTLPVVAVRLRATPTDFNPVSRREYLFFPISDRHIAVMLFTPRQEVMGNQEEMDKKVGSSTLYDLMNQIIGSLNVTLSPQAQAQQARAVASMEDTSLIKEFLPMKWITAEDEAEWEASKAIFGID